MAKISGAQALAGIQVASTWGTAVAAGAGDKLVAEITDSANESVLEPRMLGSGAYMVTTSTKSNTAPSVNISMDVGYRNNADTILAQFFGTSGSPSEQTASQADYLHTMTFNTTLNAKYLSVARETSTTTTLEYPTCAVRSITLRAEANQYAQLTAELVANKIETASAVNTNAALANVTLTDTELTAVSFDDDFWIDTQGSTTLASGDQLNITSYELTLTRPQMMPNEIKGSAGNGAPIPDGLFDGTLTVTLAELPDHAWFTAWNAETVYKSRLTIEGTQIGTGVNKAWNVYLPGMVLVTKPDVALSNPGANPVTLTFKLLKASTNPTGMSSTYPYITVVNGLSTSLLA